MMYAIEKTTNLTQQVLERATTFLGKEQIVGRKDRRFCFNSAAFATSRGDQPPPLPTHCAMREKKAVSMPPKPTAQDKRASELSNRKLGHTSRRTSDFQRSSAVTGYVSGTEAKAVNLST